MNPKRLIEIVLDRRMPDGAPATDADINAAMHLAFEHDPEFCGLLYVAKFGRRPDGESAGWDERHQALKRLARISDGREELPLPANAVAAAEEMFEKAETGERHARRELASRGLGHGAPHLRRPRPATKPLLEHAARELGYEPAELLRPIPHGRLTHSEQARRDALARAVHQVRNAGSRLDAIGAVVGISKQRVSDLARRGHELEAGPHRA